VKNNQKNIKNKIKNVVKNRNKGSKFDPFGSYTGVSVDGERPVQDQDDL
jgi:hypothetical protein